MPRWVGTGPRHDIGCSGSGFVNKQLASRRFRLVTFYDPNSRFQRLLPAALRPLPAIEPRHDSTRRGHGRHRPHLRCHLRMGVLQHVLSRFRLSLCIAAPGLGPSGCTPRRRCRRKPTAGIRTGMSHSRFLRPLKSKARRRSLTVP